MKTNLEIDISGMHCESCVQLITESLTELEGVLSVDISLKDNKGKVIFENSIISSNNILDTIKKEGYGAKILSEEDDDLDGNDFNKDFKKEKDICTVIEKTSTSSSAQKDKRASLS